MIKCIACLWEGKEPASKRIEGVTGKAIDLPVCPACQSEKLDYSKAVSSRLYLELKTI